jgi:hypothetical protein
METTLEIISRGHPVLDERDGGGRVLQNPVDQEAAVAGDIG